MLRNLCSSVDNRVPDAPPAGLAGGCRLAVTRQTTRVRTVSAMGPRSRIQALLEGVGRKGSALYLGFRPLGLESLVRGPGPGLLAHRPGRELARMPRAGPPGAPG